MRVAARGQGGRLGAVAASLREPKVVARRPASPTGRATGKPAPYRHCAVSPNSLEPEPHHIPNHEKQTANPSRGRWSACPMHTARSFRCHKKISHVGSEPQRIAEAESNDVARRESYALPCCFGSDNATHLFSWNDLRCRSEGEDVHDRRKRKIARLQSHRQNLSLEGRVACDDEGRGGQRRSPRLLLEGR
ncbi:MAG: hypothetical protein QOD12_2875 [Verrucomicrobiota bacterium]